MSLPSSQTGFGIIESLITLAVVGLGLVAMAGALSSSSLGLREVKEQVGAVGLARTQMEYTKAAAFDVTGAYPTVTPPSAYEVAVAAEAVPGADGNIQRITVTVSQEGQPVLTVEGYKVNR